MYVESSRVAFPFIHKESPRHTFISTDPNKEPRNALKSRAESRSLKHAHVVATWHFDMIVIVTTRPNRDLVRPELSRKGAAPYGEYFLSG